MAADDSGFASGDTGRLALAAAGAGFIAVSTLIVEIWTSQFFARVLGFDQGFVSLPLGATALVLAALAARSRVAHALPGLLLGAVYCLMAVLYW